MRSFARRGACALKKSSTIGTGCGRGTGSGRARWSERSSARWWSTSGRTAWRCLARVEAIHTARDADLRVAIASSSSRELIDAVVERLGIGELVDAVCSADDEERGKPDPGVYISAARALDVMPWCCVAIEDSPIGVTAAIAAGMRCIGLRSRGRARGRHRPRQRGHRLPARDHPGAAAQPILIPVVIEPRLGSISSRRASIT